MKAITLKIFIVLLFSASTFGQSENLTRSEKIEAFKTEQKCVADASERENWSMVTPCARKSLAILEDLLGKEHRSVALITYEYGLALGYVENIVESERILKLAVKRYEEIYGNHSPELIPILLDYAVAINKVGDFERNSPVSVYSRAFKIFKNDQNFDRIDYADMVSNAITEILKKNKFVYRKHTRATLRFAKEASDIYEEILGMENEKTASLNLNIGKIELARDKTSSVKSSIQYFKNAAKNEKVLPFAYAFLVRAYGQAKQNDAATEYLYKLAEIQKTELKSSSEFYPIYVAKPDYPSNAQKKGIEGYAILGLTINEAGGPIDISILEENPVNHGFGEEAIEAATDLLYVPRVVNGKGERVSGVIYKYMFTIPK